MTSFEFVFGMISVITSLTLTRLLGGCVSLYRHTDRVRFSWRHGLWLAAAFPLLLGNWAAFWRMHGIVSWQPIDVLIPLVFVSVLYAFGDMVVPEEPAEGRQLDLRDYHRVQGRRYIKLQLLFVVLALLVVARTSNDVGVWLVRASFALVAGACSVVALTTKRVWLDTLAAAVLFANGLVFMGLNLRALTA